MTILIIEDDLCVAELLQRGLEEHGFTSTLAYDGVSGRKLALQNEYDLIITDIILPKMDGIDICKSIRQAKPSTPIIMLTALGTTDDKIEGFDAGADDYLVKPFEMRELIARVRALLLRSTNNLTNERVVLKYEDLEMNRHTKMVTRHGQNIHLTPKEFNLLEFFLQHP